MRSSLPGSLPGVGGRSQSQGWRCGSRCSTRLTPHGRFGRSLIVGAAWFFPSTVWMADLTPIGWPVAAAAFSIMVGLVGWITPSDRGYRGAVFCAALVLAELIRWNWPFGGGPRLNARNDRRGDSPRHFGQVVRIADPSRVDGSRRRGSRRPRQTPQGEPGGRGRARRDTAGRAAAVDRRRRW